MQHHSQELPNRLTLDAVRGLKGVKSAELPLALGPGPGAPTKTVRVAVASGVANARRLVEEVKAGRARYDFIEVRAGAVGWWSSSARRLCERVSA